LTWKRRRKVLGKAGNREELTYNAAARKNSATHPGEVFACMAERLNMKEVSSYQEGKRFVKEARC